jgi:hypothetical protein
MYLPLFDYSNVKRVGFLKKAVCLLVVLILSVIVVPTPARADVAPPDQPPGVNPIPGKENTQVSMLAETVTMSVLKQSEDPKIGQAKVDAVFTMRNLGSAAEGMQVRFPLSFWNGWDNGFGKFPEITDLVVKVNGGKVDTERITTPNDSGIVSNPVPWAAFNVSFPPGQDVKIEVIYTGGGATESPYVSFRYILETGAGWKGVIGSVDFIVKLPYEANNLNVIFYEGTGFMSTTAGATVSGRQLSWHFDDLEPTAQNNFNVTLVLPLAWNKVLIEQDNLKANPKDGEAWGRLGKAYKEIIQQHHGLRDDPGGLEAYRLGVEAYRKAVTLLPKDSLWHTGFADLLLQHAWNTQFSSSGMDYTELGLAVSELKTAVEIDPKNQMALDLLSEIAGNFPEALQTGANGYIYLILTATPVVTPRIVATTAPTETSLPPVPTLTTPPTATYTSTPQDTVVSGAATLVPQTTPQPTAPATAPAPSKPASGPKLPCVGSLVLLPVVGLVFISRRMKTRKVN